MKKTVIAIFVCLGILFSATVQSAKASSPNDDFAKAFNQAINEMVKINNQLASCNSSLNYGGYKVLGTENGKCHFYNEFIEYDKKLVPTSECYVPLNVLKTEMQKQNEQLSKGIVSASTNQSFNSYCKKLHGTLKSNYGSLSY